ncbi:MAG: hypothetical protein K2F91_07070 [Muribaculaceae bacterium]|nr:hypothetical protein [Muribaculaceae bacterium]MDE6197609.1 hypothetical protein [Muribaculaceae bacterium]
MTRHYLSLWLLLLAAFAAFAIASAFDMPEVAGHQFKSSEIYDGLFGQREPADGAVMSADTSVSVPDTVLAGDRVVFPVPCDTAAQTIMLFGDSMLEGLGPRLAAYAEHNGHTLYTVMWYSSTSEVWGRSDKLKSYIERIKPTYIILCLGANELIVSDIARKREKYVRKILADIDTVPYLWIGPPNWRRDTGINDLIAANTPKGTFFLSDGMHFERSKDGAHPTRSSASEWLDSVMRWMPANALHPIRMDVPERATARAARIYVHQPDEK